MNKIVVLVAALLLIIATTTTVNAFVPMSTLFGASNPHQQQQHDDLLTESFATVLSDDNNNNNLNEHPWDNPNWFDLMVTNTHISQPAYRIVSGNGNRPIDQIKVEILDESEVSYFLPQGHLSVLWNLLANSYYGAISNNDVTVSSDEFTFVFKSRRRFVPLQMTVQPNFTFRLKNGSPAQQGSHVAVRFSTFLGETLVATWVFKYNIGDVTLPLSSNGLVPYSRLNVVQISTTQAILNVTSALISFVVYILIIITLVCAYRAQVVGSWIQNPLFMKPVPNHFQPENSIYTPKQH
eukprot:UN01829